MAAVARPHPIAFCSAISEQCCSCSCGEHEALLGKDDHGAFHDRRRRRATRSRGCKVITPNKTPPSRSLRLGKPWPSRFDADKAAQGEWHGAKHACPHPNLISGIPAKHQINASAARKHHRGPTKARVRGQEREGYLSPEREDRDCGKRERDPTTVPSDFGMPSAKATPRRG